MVEHQEREAQGQEAWSTLCLCYSYHSHSPLHQHLHLSNGDDTHCQRDHCSDEGSREENPVTVMPKLRRFIKKACWMGLEGNLHRSSQESHTIAYFVAFILRTHGPIFHQLLKIWLGGITISGHLVMLQSEKITYPRLWWGSGYIWATTATTHPALVWINSQGPIILLENHS